MEKIKFEALQVSEELATGAEFEIQELDDVQLAYVGGGQGEITPY